MSSDLEQLQINLNLQDAQFKKGMKSAGRSIERLSNQTTKVSSRLQTAQKFMTKFAAAGAAIAGLGAGFAAYAKGLISTTSALAKTADATGIGIEQFQALQYAAERAGLSTSQLASNLTAFVKRVGESRNGMGPLVSGLKRLNPELLENIRNSKSQNEALRLVSESIKTATTATERAAIANAAFGRSGIGMVNMLRDGEKGLIAYQKQAESLGIVIEERLVRSAEEFDDKLLDIERQFKTTFGTATLSLIAAVHDQLDALSSSPTTAGGLTERIADTYEDLKSARNTVQSLAGDTSDYSKRLYAAASNSVTRLEADLKRLQELRWELQAPINPPAATVIDVNAGAPERAPAPGLDANAMMMLDKEIKALEVAEVKTKEIEQGLSELNPYVQQFEAGFSSAISGAFKNGKFAVADFGSAVLDTINDIMISQAVKSFFKMFSFGDFFAGAGGAGGAGGTSRASALTAITRSLSQGSVRSMTAQAPTSPPAGAFVGIRRSARVDARKPSSGSGSGGLVSVNVINSAGVNVETQQKENAGGGVDIDIMLTDRVRSLFANGGMDRTMLQTFGMRRRGL